MAKLKIEIFVAKECIVRTRKEKRKNNRVAKMKQKII